MTFICLDEAGQPTPGTWRVEAGPTEERLYTLRNLSDTSLTCRRALDTIRPYAQPPTTFPPTLESARLLYGPLGAPLQVLVQSGFSLPHQAVTSTGDHHADGFMTLQEYRAWKTRGDEDEEEEEEDWVAFTVCKFSISPHWMEEHRD